MSGSYLANYLYLPYLAIYVIFTFFGTIFVCNLFFDTKDYQIFSKHKYKRYRKKFCIPFAQICKDFFEYCCCCFKCNENFCCGVPVPLLIIETLNKSRFEAIGTFVLLFTRILSFLYLIYAVVIPNNNDGGEAFNKFSAWVNMAMCFTFLLLAIRSLIHCLLLICYGGETRSPWPIWIQRIAVLIHFFYEVVFTNAVYVTVMEYAYQQRETTYSTFRGHLIPALICFVDSIVNIIPFRLEHYHYCLALPIAYLIFQWISVIRGDIDWQYSFLKVNSPRCFGRYSVLFAIHVACFLGIYVLQFARDQVNHIKYEQRYRVIFSRPGDEHEDEEQYEDEYAGGGNGGDIEFSDVYASQDQHGRFVGSASEDVDDNASIPSAPPSNHGGGVGGISGHVSPRPVLPPALFTPTPQGSTRTVPPPSMAGGITPQLLPPTPQANVPMAVPIYDPNMPAYSRKAMQQP